MREVAQQYAFVWLGEIVVPETDQRAAYELVTLFLVFECKADFPGAAEKVSNLVDGVNIVVIHDGFHPSIMTGESA